MPTVIRQHIINMLEPMEMLCIDAYKWLEEQCLPSDTFPIIYRRLLDHACKRRDIREWLLVFYRRIGLEEAEDLLWHYVKVKQPETLGGWCEVIYGLPDAREVEEALGILYNDWCYDQATEGAGEDDD